VKEISLTKTKEHFILYSLLYNKKVYNLMMVDIEAETCSFKTSYVETPLSNVNIKSCV
jgi:hypothetical protein